MKRDMELVRQILLTAESTRDAHAVEGYDREAAAYHVALLKEAGLIEALVAKDQHGHLNRFVVRSLTWAGHDFLDAARSDTVWRTAKEKILTPGVSWTFDLLKATLKALAAQQLAKIGLPPIHE